MRPGHLLLLVFVGLLFGLESANPALAQSLAAPSTQTPILNSNKDPSFNFSGRSSFPKPSNGLASEFRMPLPADSSPDTRRLAGFPIQPATRQNQVCYAMRTYRVTRIAPDSDAVQPSGSTTCQPSSTYSVKNAVGPIPSPSR